MCIFLIGVIAWVLGGGFKLKNTDHPVLKRKQFEAVEWHYCPKCEMDMFMTKSEMIAHLDNHRMKYENGLLDNDDMEVSL